MATSAIGTRQTEASALKLRDVLVRARLAARPAELLTPGALRFLATLHRELEPQRRRALALRAQRRAAIQDGAFPGFLAETAWMREAHWRVAPAPRDLLDRRVEITGPTERKTLINALNSGARVFMADFEDASSPAWDNMMDGQVNLHDYVGGELSYTSPDGRWYEPDKQVATLMVRPRGWHLLEKHVTVDDEPISASLFDFGLYFYHNAQALCARGSGPYFYLPKLENHHEARLWNDAFVLAQEQLGLPRGTVRATVLIETILAAFEMEEILYELREHSAGLNCGRWDYIFSLIKTLGHRPDFVLPDRSQITMERHFLRSYSDLLVRTCHRRGAHAIGGMAAQIPIKDDPAANELALEKVRQDKRREAAAGYDGTWVAHPALVPVAREVFDAAMPDAHQIHLTRDDVRVTAQDLLAPVDGEITLEGLRTNVDVAVQYVEAWLRGVGCVPLYHLMEDAATAEISRSQVWQWLRHGARLPDGRPVTVELIRLTAARVLDRIEHRLGNEAFKRSQFFRATKLLDRLVTAPECPEFFTTAAYDYLD
ncbi:MAG TPA: malate synthase A [Gemmatimonadales bacterium]